MTDFVEFILKNGTTRMTHVRNILRRGDYSPMTDFYKGLRESIVEFHRQGSANPSILAGAIAKGTQSNRGVIYKERVDAYTRFLGKKDVQWFEPPRAEWTFADLTVRLNPELGLRWRGQDYVIKLYLKDERLTKRQVELILFLMHINLAPLSPDGASMGVLDVSTGKLFTKATLTEDLSPLLRSEARAFIELWNSLSPSSD